MLVYKVCIKCKENKPISDFYSCKNASDGHQSSCKNCQNIAQKEYRKNHRELYAESARKWRRNNPDKYREIYKKSHNLHKEERNAKHREWTKEHREYCNEYRKKQKNKYKEYYNEYMKNKRVNDPIWYYSIKLLYPIRYVLKNRGECISHRAEEITGLPADKLYLHLINSWKEKYGTEWNGEPYDIDHIIPRKTAKTKEEMDSLFRYTNLRLLSVRDNRSNRKE